MLITLKFSATVRKALSSGLIRSSSISLHSSVAGSVLQEVKMNRKKLSGRKLFLLIWLGVIVLLLVGIAVLSKLNPTEHTESVKEAMRDGVKLYAPLKGKKEFCGELVSFDAESFTVRTLPRKPGEASETVTVGRRQAALVRPHIDF